jgi:hypothetical protein
MIFSASEVVAAKSAFLVSNKEALPPVATSLGHHRRSARKRSEGDTSYSFRLRVLKVKAGQPLLPVSSCSRCRSGDLMSLKGAAGRVCLSCHIRVNAAQGAT